MIQQYIVPHELSRLNQVNHMNKKSDLFIYAQIR